MTKTQRAFYDIINSFGCEVIAAKQNKHLRVKCRDGRGRVFSATIPFSPSDWRAEKNFAAQIAKHLAA